MLRESARVSHMHVIPLTIFVYMRLMCAKWIQLTRVYHINLWKVAQFQSFLLFNAHSTHECIYLYTSPPQPPIHPASSIRRHTYNALRDSILIPNTIYISTFAYLITHINWIISPFLAWCSSHIEASGFSSSVSCTLSFRSVRFSLCLVWLFSVYASVSLFPQTWYQLTANCLYDDNLFDLINLWMHG